MTKTPIPTEHSKEANHAQKRHQNVQLHNDYGRTKNGQSGRLHPPYVTIITTINTTSITRISNVNNEKNKDIRYRYILSYDNPS